ncbi:MAG: hypothetical protein V2I66_12965 [Halieaceae bacterium]|nr:hypothetical protein [Halieaceae bacterium]
MPDQQQRLDLRAAGHHGGHDHLSHADSPERRPYVGQPTGCSTSEKQKLSGSAGKTVANR